MFPYVRRKPRDDFLPDCHLALKINTFDVQNGRLRHSLENTILNGNTFYNQVYMSDNLNYPYYDFHDDLNKFKITSRVGCDIFITCAPVPTSPYQQHQYQRKLHTFSESTVTMTLPRKPWPHLLFHSTIKKPFL